jgi:TRAP-type C4-dicarboxylate transport system permease small subunit
VKKTLLFLREVMEVYIPIAAFIMLFLAFILQVFFRYVLRSPLTWTKDLIVLGFCWSVILGTCYTMREKSHVMFTMLYDSYSPKVAAWARMIGNILIVFTFALMIVPSFKYAFFVGFQKTAALRIPLTWLFIPYTYFLFSIIGYSIAPIIEDWKVITGKLEDSFDHSYDPLLGEVKK